MRSRGYKFEPEVAAEMDKFFFERIIIWSDFHLSEEDGEEEELGRLQNSHGSCQCKVDNWD